MIYSEVIKETEWKSSKISFGGSFKPDCKFVISFFAHISSMTKKGTLLLINKIFRPLLIQNNWPKRINFPSFDRWQTHMLGNTRNDRCVASSILDRWLSSIIMACAISLNNCVGKFYKRTADSIFRTQTRYSRLGFGKGHKFALVENRGAKECVWMARRVRK